MNKYRVIFTQEKYRVLSRSKFGFWKQRDYFYKEEDALRLFNDLIKNGESKVIVESEWI